MTAQNADPVSDGDISPEYNDFRGRIFFHSDYGIFSYGYIFVDNGIGYGRALFDNTVCQDDGIFYDGSLFDDDIAAEDGVFYPSLNFAAERDH